MFTARFHRLGDLSALQLRQEFIRQPMAGVSARIRHLQQQHDMARRTGSMLLWDVATLRSRGDVH